LVSFEPKETDPGAIVEALHTLVPVVNDIATPDPSLPHAVHEHTGDVARARITVRGLDRDPRVTHVVLTQLLRHPGVLRVAASALTGRVLVEYSTHQTTLQDLLAEVSHLELPEVIGEDEPAHPLDPAPLFQALVRTIGAGLGLTLLALEHITGYQEPPRIRETAGRTAGVIGILLGIPAVRTGLRRLLGRNTADLVLHVPTILVLTLAGSPLGLATTGVESLRLLTEVIARRSVWRRYEERLQTVADAHPGAVVRLESGDRTPLAAYVIEGFATSTGLDGLPTLAAPGVTVSAGSRLFGGVFVLELQGGETFTPEKRPSPMPATAYDRYLRALGPVSLGYAALTALLTRSVSRTFAALLLVSPRTALIGKEFADTSASARVLRAGVVVVGTRPERVVRLPNVLVLHGPRILTEAYEVTAALSLNRASDGSEILNRASNVASAAGSPWGGAFEVADRETTDAGAFNGTEASAHVAGTEYSLGELRDDDSIPATLRIRYRGARLLALRVEGRKRPLGLLVLQPRLAPGVAELKETCRRYGVDLRLQVVGDPAANADFGQRTGIDLIEGPVVEVIRASQAEGAIVAFVSDNAQGAAYDAADMAIGLTSGRSGRLPARADFLAPDLSALAAIIEAGARREKAINDSILFTITSNVFGAAWGLRSEPGVLRASYGVYASSLGAMSAAWLRLRGGERSATSINRLVDPHPERWGRRAIEEVMRTLKTSGNGLTSEEAALRLRVERPPSRGNGLMGPILDQIRSPLTGILAAGAGLSFLLGSTADVFMIGATMCANILVGVWQERQTDQAIAALSRMGTSTARVLRDGKTTIVRVQHVVPGDVLVLAAGDRVSADARIISAHQLEVDEAALTGESLPNPKDAVGGTDESRVVLAGSDVTVGTGRAIVTAVGRGTRLGATAAALALDETRTSPLGIRLNRMLRLILPLAAGGGLLVLASGWFRRRPLLPQLAIGASVAIAAVPEGLPLLAGVGEAAVARRLAGRNALVRRLSAVEAMGRVDIACTDKTGTLTEGRLALTTVATLTHESSPNSVHEADVRRVLVTAGLATPHPDAGNAGAHPTDLAVIEGVTSAGLGDELRAHRDQELLFDPVRMYHAAVFAGTSKFKGAVESLVPRCTSIRVDGAVSVLDEAGREALLARAQELSARGLRVLMVAEGHVNEGIDDPRELTALGFVGISDPLRPEVRAAVRRCHDAGVRVIMLTGDHPATARAIAHQAGILGEEDAILTGQDIAELQDRYLDERLERATVVARVTPLDKLRIVESLQRRGHTVAMTGDGVNDAPALRLADVGVAMGKNGTEVARQAADIVLADDDFSTLVEALVEGRSFWRNIRRAVALLLGGNLGELGLVVGASVMGLASPLLTRQILAVNLVTDVLPSLAVALQPPEHRNLAGLDREGTAALDRPLRRDVQRRGFATAVPSLLAYIVSLRSSGLAEARAVAFASVVGTQLAQTLDAGRTEDSLTRSVLGAVVASAGVLVAALTLPPIQQFLNLVAPTPAGWGLILLASAAAAVFGRGLPVPAFSPVNGSALPTPRFDEARKRGTRGVRLSQ
jgi:calcium-translocating P-type ATPase